MPQDAVTRRCILNKKYGIYTMKVAGNKRRDSDYIGVRHAHSMIRPRGRALLAAALLAAAHTKHCHRAPAKAFLAHANNLTKLFVVSLA